MKKQQEEKLKSWVQHWHKAEHALAKLKLKELRSPDYYEKNMFILNEMLKISARRSETSKNSGLVELQKWFKKIHENKAKK